MTCHCGREKCQGKACGNFGTNGCKGVDWSVPPWSCVDRYDKGLNTLSKLIQEDIDGRKEDAK